MEIIPSALLPLDGGGYACQRKAGMGVKKEQNGFKIDE